MSVWEGLLTVAALLGILALTTIICLAIIKAVANHGRRN